MTILHGWIPSPENIKGNKEADSLVRKGRELPQLDLSIAKSKKLLAKAKYKTKKEKWRLCYQREDPCPDRHTLQRQHHIYTN